MSEATADRAMQSGSAEEIVLQSNQANEFSHQRATRPLGRRPSDAALAEGLPNDVAPQDNPRPMTPQPNSAVLDGIRVLDFGKHVAGPWCGALLADLGAEVLRIERPSGGDDRYIAPVAE
ncbi:CoA transferase, partial [Mycobacterium avium]